MDSVTWTDVLGTIPRPVQAHDAVSFDGTRRVQRRMTLTPAAAQPYAIEVQLWDSGKLIEIWLRAHAGGTGTNAAYRSYAVALEGAERWLVGRRLGSARPRTFQVDRVAHDRG